MTNNYIKEVADLFDVQVLRDLTGDICTFCDGKGTDKQDNLCSNCRGAAIVNEKTVYCLGQPAEPSAGFPTNNYMTPWFDNTDALETFCQQYIDRFREIAKQQATSGNYEAIDATQWS